MLLNMIATQTSFCITQSSLFSSLQFSSNNFLSLEEKEKHQQMKKSYLLL